MQSKNKEKQKRADAFRRNLITGDLIASKPIRKTGIIQKAVLWVADKTGLELKKTAPKVASYVFQPKFEIRRPVYDYADLMFEAMNSWLIRIIARVIISEVTTPRWHRTPNFVKKCRSCGKEYRMEDAKCKCGSTKFRVPSERQARIFDNLLKTPNNYHSFLDIVRSAMVYLLLLDDFYVYIQFRETRNRNNLVKKEPVGLYVLDSRFTLPMADARGRLGSDQYYCPICYAMSEKDIYVDRNSLSESQRARPMCEKHNIPMYQTAYVQEVSGQIVARFTADQVAHGSLSRVLPELFGNPKVASIIKLLRSINSMDDYNYEVYSEGKVGSIIAFPKYEPEQVTEIKTSIENELGKKDKADIQSGARTQSRKIRTLFLPVEEPPVRIPIMESLEAMQSLDFYKIWIEKICAVYGVTPVFTSIIEGGRLGTAPRLQIDVQDRVTREYQKAFEDFMNLLILPIFKITDWSFKFNEIEQRDRLRDSQIEHEKAATALTWLQCGFDVEISPSGELIVSGKGEKFPQRSPQLQKPESRTSGAAEGVQSVDRETEDKVSEETEGFKKDIVPLPSSWYESTQMKLMDDEFAIVEDKDEVYVSMNGKEYSGTRTPSNQFSLAIARLLDVSLAQLGLNLYGPGFPKDEFDNLRRSSVAILQRKYDSNILLSIIQFFDRVYLPEIAAQLNELRARLDKIKPSTTESVV